jgi:uncharacterized protein (DUF58 family)
MNTVHALKALQLKAKDQAYSILAGQHLSKLQGEGYDFSTLREYQMGDDIRKIHWMSTAKLGKPYVKELHSNRELSVAVCAFLDGGLYFGTGNKKQEKLSEVTMILGYLVEMNADLFTGIAYSQKETIYTPPSKQRYHIETFAKSLFEASVMHTQLDIPSLIKDLFERLSKPSLLFVLADFMEELDLALLAQRHEVIAIIIRDKEEENPRILGECMLKNPQKSQSIESYFGKKSMQEYLKHFHAHEQKRQAHFDSYGIQSIQIFTEDNIVEKLIQGLK